jgi:Type II secretion system (T2SS), protein M subtype b
MSLSAWIVAQPLRTRRMLALLAGPLLVLTAWSLIVGPLMGLYDAHQEWLAAAEASVARDRGMRAAESRLSKQLADIEHSPLLSRLYPAGPPGTLATALQADLGGLLTGTGVSAQSISPLPVTFDGDIERAGVRVTLAFTIDQLRAFLSALESHPHLIRVDELIVTAPQSQANDHNPTLTVSMVLLGFRLRAGALAGGLG